MGKPTRATRAKRSRERALQDKRKEKLERRLYRRLERANGPGPRAGEDPDLAGIVPGPQPHPWPDA